MNYSITPPEAAEGFTPAFCEALTVYSGEGETDQLAEVALELADDNTYARLILLKLLEEAYPELQSRLGRCYYLGIGVEKNKERALQLFQLAKSRGCIRSNYDLGWYYYELSEYMRAIEFFRICIDNQDELTEGQIEDCYVCLGDSYIKISEPKISLAIEYLSIASDKYHNAFASAQLGRIYGEKGSQYFDAEKCINYLQAGYKNGDASAANYLASKYLIGDEDLKIPINGKIAEEILKDFLYEKNFEIQKNLGVLYMNGDPEHGVTWDYLKAQEHYELAWQLSHDGLVASALGYVYFRLEKYKEAEEKLVFADAAGFCLYSDFLGRIYKIGLSGQVDRQKAIYYYGRAYGTGSFNNLFTCNEYAMLLEETGNYSLAYEVADKGQKEFNDLCFYFLKAKLILRGDVVDKESAEEAVWIMKECDKRSFCKEEAHILLARYYLRNQEYRNAEKYLLDAFEDGDTEAAVTLGHLYEYGGGTITADEGKAYIWYQKAADAGNITGAQEVSCFKKGLFGRFRRIRSLNT